MSSNANYLFRDVFILRIFSLSPLTKLSEIGEKTRFNYDQNADSVLIYFVCFDSHSLFYIKLHIRGRIEHQPDKENLAREISFLSNRHRVQMYRKEVQPKNVIAICVEKCRLRLLTLFGQKLSLPLRSS